MNDEAKRAVVRKLFETFNAGDLDAAAETVTDDFTLVDHAMGQTLEGPDGLRTWLAGFRRALPDARTELTTLVVEGDLVASEHVGRGTHTGPLATPAGDVPPTGRAVELHIAEVYEIRDGRLASLRAYYDSATLMRQLGLLSDTA